MLDGMNIKDIHSLLKELSKKEKEILNQKRLHLRSLNLYLYMKMERKLLKKSSSIVIHTS